MVEINENIVLKVCNLVGYNYINFYIQEFSHTSRNTGLPVYVSILKTNDFLIFLLSPEFIEKFAKSTNGDYFFDGQEKRVARIFGMQIHEYQKGNSQPLIDLLEKI